jgi:hypothetical protein
MSLKTPLPLIKVMFSLTVGILFGLQTYLSAPPPLSFSSSIIMHPMYLPLILRQIPYHIYLPVVWHG